MTFRFDNSVAVEYNGANGVVILLLFEGGAETVHSVITVEEKRAGVVGDGVSVGVDEAWGRGRLVEKLSHNGLNGGSKDELDALFGKGVDGRILFAISRIIFLK